MLKLDNIYGGYSQGSSVIQGINLEISKGEIVGIIGLNGCGKSTLGKAVMNLIPYRTGNISYNGIDISKLKTFKLKQLGISMLMQGGRIFPQMTIKENLKLASGARNEQELKNSLKVVDEKFGFTTFMSNLDLNRKGSYLSGGERQQVALLMALLGNPSLLILDEVSAGLSAASTNEFTTIITTIKKNKNISIMLIEQNISVASTLSDRMYYLERNRNQEIPQDIFTNLDKLKTYIFNNHNYE